MKRITLILTAILATLTATAQTAGYPSEIKGDKLDFEAPLFGVTKKNIKPKWSVVAFAEVNGGFSYRFNVPEQIHPDGGYAELNLLELRYRPMRNGNLFSLGLSGCIDAHMARKTNFFGMDGQFTTMTPGWLAARAIAAERVISLTFGYTRESGDWKTGVFISPGVGHAILQNRYWAGVPVYDPDTGLYVLDSIYKGFVGSYRHRDNMYMPNGLRLGVSAGIWYRSVGLTVGWHRRSIDRYGSGDVFSDRGQNVIHAGISIRY
ncbi:MAG: hypothetical protein J6X69_08045 [Bacteroidales bacterium]|nr:hypothetical protein [Bacteroidales bacterium]